MYKIKLVGQKGPRGGTSTPYFYGLEGRKAVAVTKKNEDLIKTYKSIVSATKGLDSAKKAFPESTPELIEF